MLHRCRKKLNSRRGASFLLALLFFLVCALAASSVLMAASSKAGRSRSSREEHQLYLAASSAVRLLCDELNACQYQGQYEYTFYPRQFDEKGQVIQEERHILTQKPGLYRYQNGGGDAALESLLNDFDYIFSQEFDQANIVRPMTSITRLPVQAPVEHTLTITPEGTDTVLDGRPVTVTLLVRESYAMYLTARMPYDGPAGESEYVLQAELTPSGTAPRLPDAFLQGVHPAENTMTWRIGWIVPEETAEGEEMTAGA